MNDLDAITAMAKAMHSAGSSGETMIVAIEAFTAIANEKQLERRQGETMRKREYRRSQKDQQNQQSCPGDIRDIRDNPLPPSPPSPPDKEKVSIPLKEINLPSPLYPPSPISTGWSKSRFDQFWELYPNKVGRAKALEKFKAATKRASFEEIILGLQRYVGKTDDRPWCNPATWLHQDRWEDIPATVIPFVPPKKRTSYDLADELRAAANAASGQDQPDDGGALAVGFSEIIPPKHGWKPEPRAHEGDGVDFHPVSGKDPPRDLLAADRDGYQF